MNKKTENKRNNNNENMNILNIEKSNLFKEMLNTTFSNYCLIEYILDVLNKYKVINRTLDEYNIINEEKTYLTHAKNAIAEVYNNFYLVKKKNKVNVNYLIHNFDKNHDCIIQIIDEHEQQLNMIDNHYGHIINNSKDKQLFLTNLQKYVHIIVSLRYIMDLYQKIGMDLFSITDMLEDYQSGVWKPTI